MYIPTCMSSAFCSTTILVRLCTRYYYRQLKFASQNVVNYSGKCLLNNFKTKVNSPLPSFVTEKLTF